MRRREFVAGLTGVAAWPLVVEAQQPERVRRVAVLMAYPPSDSEIQSRVSIFKQELEKLGWIEGKNLTLGEWWPSDDMSRVSDAIDDILSKTPDLVLLTGRRIVEILRHRTRSVPVIFAGMSDPVATGVVDTLARPGRNFTGFTLWEPTITGKMLELLKYAAPGIARSALIYNPDNPATVVFSELFQAAAERLGVVPTFHPIKAMDDVEGVISSLAKHENSSLFFPPDVTITTQRHSTVSLVARHRLPAIYSDPIIVKAGGLMSYGPDREDIFRRAAAYADRILRGEKAETLPVQEPTKYRLVVNLKAARTIGVNLQESLLARADEVIE